MMQAIGTLAMIERIDSGENGDLMHMMLSEHRERGAWGGLTPGKEVSL
jgi:hypothetical protein